MKNNSNYEVGCTMRAFDLSKAGTAIKLDVRDRYGLFGTVEIGQGSISWRSANGKKTKRIPWSEFAERMK